MKYVKFLNDMIKGYRILLVILFCITFFLTYTRTIVPQFLSYAIDNILLKQDTQFVSLFDNLVHKSDDMMTQILILCIILVLFQTMRAIVLYIRTAGYYKISESVMKKLRNRLYIHLQHLPYSYFKKNNSGDIIQRSTTDMEAIRTFVGSDLFQFIWAFSIVIATMFTMFKISVIYTIVISIIFPFVFIVSLYYAKIIQKQFHKIDQAESSMTDVVKENITNVEVVKAFGSQKYEYEKYLNKSKPFYKEMEGFFKSLAKMESITLFFRLLQYLIAIVVGIILYERNLVTVGTILLFLSYIKLLSNPIKMLGRLLSRLGRLTVAISRIEEIFNSSTETIEEDTPVIEGSIKFNDVSFKFSDGKVPALKNISFEIKKGQNIAIIGKTGSGKSTLINLLSRMYEPTEGKILIDNNDISTINKKYLRNNIGLVSQEPYIFSKTVEENIGITKSFYEENDIVKFSKIASIHEDIIDFKDGYKTTVGEHGATLSGGQRQRIAIARTLLSEQNILVFDDSLSAVDNETDKKIRQALMDNDNITTILVTHKISSITSCDKVIVLENGSIIEDDTIDNLLKANGYFKQLYDLQLGDNI